MINFNLVLYRNNALDMLVRLLELKMTPVNSIIRRRIRVQIAKNTFVSENAKEVYNKIWET